MALVLLATVLQGCAVHLDDEAPGHELAEARVRCVVAAPAGTERSGALSLAFDQGAYWIFRETREPGFLGVSGATVAVGDDPCTDLADVRDGQGSLVPLLALTPEEEAANQAPVDGRRIALWPRAAFSHQGEGYIFYEKLRVGDGFDIITVGVGVARIRWGQPAERIVVGAHADEPTLLWLEPQSPGWARGAFVAQDGLAYVYRCHERDVWDLVCRVARVMPDQVGDLGAYRHFDGQEWVPEPERAAVILEGVPGLSVAYSQHLNRYLAVCPEFLANHVFARTAAQPWGPFGIQHELYEGAPPSELWIFDVAQHSAHASADGRTLLTSYYSDPPGDIVGMRLVEIGLK